MRTLDLQEAASFLRMSSEGLRRKIAKGELPACKVGKRWLFLEDDLVQHMRSGYATPPETSWGVVGINRRTTWHSIKEATSGGLPLPTKEQEYRKALGLPIK